MPISNIHYQQTEVSASGNGDTQIMGLPKKKPQRHATEQEIGGPPAHPSEPPALRDVWGQGPSRTLHQEQDGRAGEPPAGKASPVQESEQESEDWEAQ